MTTDTPDLTTSSESITVTTDPANLVLMTLSKAILVLYEDNATSEDFLLAMDIKATATRLLKEFSARLVDAQIDYLHRIGEAGRTPEDDPDKPLYGDVSTPTGRFYVGGKKTTKCRDVTLAVKALLTAGGGDESVLLRCLASDALKQGECKGVLGDKIWAKHFEVNETQDIKSGKATREIKKSQA